MRFPLLLCLLALGCGGKDDTAGEDLDGDGHGAARDCDDDDPDVHPDAQELPYNGVDDDCDDATPDDDLDGDGYDRADDCDDEDATASPAGAEVCDGRDNDCDGTVDDEALDAIAWYDDRDGDGFGDPATRRLACEQPFGFVQDDTDCDDARGDVFPGAEEVWDGADNDCDGETDEDGGAPEYSWYHDADGDGFGDPDDEIRAPEQPFGYLANDTDCDDTDPEIHPGAAERCNQLDDDCDGSLDEDGACLDLDVATADDRWLGEAAGDAAGQALAGGQDISGDGQADLLVGAPGSSVGGQFYVVPGSYIGYFTDRDLDAASSSGAITWDPPHSGWELGASLAMLPDVDGDGGADFAVGSPGATGNASASGIAVLWFSGDEAYTLLSNACANAAEGVVAAAGDVDRDGLQDVALGAPGFAEDLLGQGQVELYLGDASDDIDLGAVFLGDSAGDALGAALSTAGDLDGDGYDELCMGATGYPAGGGNGAVWVAMGHGAWPGSALPLDDVEFQLVGLAGNDQAGSALAGGEDFDGDGYADLAVGVPYDGTAATTAGAVYVWPGGRTWFASSGTWSMGAAPLVFTGEASANHAGASIALLQDFDAHGRADLAVGAPTFSSGSAPQRGKVYLVLGSPAWSGSHSLAEADASWLGEQASDALGTAVASAGDADGDGVTDLLLGAPGNDDGGSGAGKVYVLLGW